MIEERILVSGASGQIGTALVEKLREVYGRENVLATDIKKPSEDNEPFVMMDILNVQRMNEILFDYDITQVYHLAAILSANGEWNPAKTWNVNLNGLLSILEICSAKGLKLFFPSSIAIFGPSTPKVNTPQDSPVTPETVYGISKVAGELWANYYHKRYGLDVRSVRYPGIISYQSMPGGGTTDYAVEIFHAALQEGSYTCFLKPDTMLPMMYMDDALRATLKLMEADPDQITVRTSYNLAGMSFTPAQLAAEIRKHIPDFKISYAPDFRQAIADSWSASIDDQKAKQDWHWAPEYDLAAMVEAMINHLKPHVQPAV